MADPNATTNDSSIPPTTTAVGSSSASTTTTTWRKISLPLPHLFPHLTINFRGHLPGRPPSPPSNAASGAPPPAAKTKTSRDWKLRRQKTYDSPGCLNAKTPASRLAVAPEDITKARKVKYNDIMKKEI